MLRTLHFFSLLFFLVFSKGTFAESLPVINPVVSAGKALSFGVWKIYNQGTDIVFLDQEDFRLIVVNLNATVLIADVDDQGFQLFASGSSMPRDGFWYQRFAQEVRDAEIKGKMLNARYESGRRILLVEGDEITIIDSSDENDSIVSTTTILNRFDNGVLHSGRDQITVIDPTFGSFEKRVGNLSYQTYRLRLERGKSRS